MTAIARIVGAWLCVVGAGVVIGAGAMVSTALGAALVGAFLLLCGVLILRSAATPERRPDDTPRESRGEAP